MTTEPATAPNTAQGKVEEPGDLEAGLNALAGRLAPGGRLKDLRRLTAGATQEVWRFELVDGSRETPLILRRAPGGTRVSETAIGLEVEALLLEAAAAKGVPVPAVRHVLAPDDGLGHGFIMEFVEGETLGGRIVRSEALAPARVFLARQCGEVLAKVHTMDPDAFPMLRRATPAERPPVGASGVVFNTQSRAEFDANWARQTGCADQVDVLAGSERVDAAREGVGRADQDAGGASGGGVISQRGRGGGEDGTAQSSVGLVAGIVDDAVVSTGRKLTHD